uniref:Uncharacterized protein n=1 Tax=Ditylenchus dipsaci TaxID=166011 RepID=A0A915D3S3_9BILA
MSSIQARLTAIEKKDAVKVHNTFDNAATMIREDQGGTGSAIDLRDKEFQIAVAKKKLENEVKAVDRGLAIESNPEVLASARKTLEKVRTFSPILQEESLVDENINRKGERGTGPTTPNSLVDWEAHYRVVNERQGLVDPEVQEQLVKDKSLGP